MDHILISIGILKLVFLYYRPLIWRYLLKLPENRAGYEALLDQGTNASFKDFRKKFPLKSDRGAKSMERILSCLAFWSPIFEDLDYLPALVFPFVKLFWNDIFSCLEVIMTLLGNHAFWDFFILFSELVPKMVGILSKSTNRNPRVNLTIDSIP
jgi:hypothetical protein